MNPWNWTPYACHSFQTRWWSLLRCPGSFAWRSLPGTSPFHLYRCFRLAIVVRLGLFGFLAAMTLNRILVLLSLLTSLVLVPTLLLLSLFALMLILLSVRLRILVLLLLLLLIALLLSLRILESRLALALPLLSTLWWCSGLEQLCTLNGFRVIFPFCKIKLALALD